MNKKERKAQKKELKAMKKLSGEVTSFWQDFIAFVKRGNAFSMAIGLVVGSAFTSIVTSFNKDIIMPFIGAICHIKDLAALRVPLWNAKEVVIDGVLQYDEYGQVLYDNAIYYGRLLQAAIDFIIIAFVLFVILRIVTSIANNAKKNMEKIKAKFEKENEVPAQEKLEPVIPEDVKLLTEIRDLLKEEKTKE